MCILNAFGTLNNVLPDIKLFLDRQFKNHPSTILVYHLTMAHPVRLNKQKTQLN